MTINEAAFADLVSADTAGEPEALHYVCAGCFPVPRPGNLALCGYVCREGELEPTPAGKHKCAKCLAWNARATWPCGHR
jgi:hypothetical protein